MKWADLHVHTISSDGAYTPAEALAAAQRHGLSALGITDHDSVGALAEAERWSEHYGVEVVPGVEISIDLGDNEIHLLGYCIDYRDPGLLEKLEILKRTRFVRAQAMLKKLRDLGYPLDLEKLLPGQMSGTVGRLHIAQALLRAGFIGSLQEAFQKLIGRKGPAYVPKSKLAVKEAIGLINRVGGIPVLAHPGNLKHDDLIPGLIECGLAGLEAYYPSHSAAEVDRYLKLAARYGLLVTGGSDCHGINKGEALMGIVKVPYDLVEGLRNSKSGRKA